jgi:hypothetical protein
MIIISIGETLRGIIVISPSVSPLLIVIMYHLILTPELFEIIVKYVDYLNIIYRLKSDPIN